MNTTAHKGAIALLVLSLIPPALARDGDSHGNHGNLKAWFDHLASGKGLCCSFADGSAVEDVDWDAQVLCNDSNDSGHCAAYYRVRLHGEWVVVPPSAVVTGPNKAGLAVVWPYQDSIGTTQIRCFLPGPQF